MEKFILEINDFGRINKANVEINKINVVGGVNASGKSTASKLLYSFLKSISQDMEEYILPKIIRNLNNIINYTEYSYEEYYKFPPKIDISANKTEVLNEFDEYRDKMYEIRNSASQNLKMELRLDETISLLELLEENNENVLTSFCVSSLLSDEYLINFVPEVDDYYRIFDGSIKFFTDSFESKIHSDIKIEHDDSSELVDIICDADYDWENNQFYHLTKGSIKKINNVFYIGNMSFFDLDDYVSSPNFEDRNRSFVYEEHMEYLINNLNSDIQGNIPSENVIDIIKRIDSIIGGSFHSLDYLWFAFSQDGENDMSPVNTSSGIKQIGILQLLLIYNKLSSGSFLIIDEPEVNLHPDWQFKFAEILVLLAKELDIVVYINSHSPMFIESIAAFTEFYNMQDEVNYYLTEKSEIEDKYNFIKIPSNKLFKIYNNLGNVYDLIDELRLKKYLGEGDG